MKQKTEYPYTVRKSSIYDEWQVVQLIDTVAIFPFNHTSHSESVAQKRAEEYAAWKNKQLEAKNGKKATRKK